MTDTEQAPTGPAPAPAAFPERGPRLPELDPRLAAFLTEESAALDERDYQGWLGLLAEDFMYQVPVPLVREDPALPRFSDTAVLFEATKRMLAMKLGRVGQQHAWSDRPAGVVRHFVGGVRVFAGPTPGTLRVDSNLLATFNRGSAESALITAGRWDIVTEQGDGYRLSRRRVLLDVEVPTYEQLSIIF